MKYPQTLHQHQEALAQLDTPQHILATQARHLQVIIHQRNIFKQSRDFILQGLYTAAQQGLYTEKMLQFLA